MRVEFTIKNYRCFEDTNPLKFTLENGFTAFIGSNNSGKSSILKFFYEFRSLFNLLANENAIIVGVQGQFQHINIIGVNDPKEIFCNLNNRDLEIELTFPLPELLHPSALYIKRANIVISPNDLNFSMRLLTKDAAIQSQEKIFALKLNPPHIPLTTQLNDLANFSSFLELFKQLSKIIYVGAFRNAINVGAGSYFDIKVGTDFIDVWHEWKTGKEKKLNAFIQNVSKDIQHIFGYNDLEIIASKELNTLQVYANGKSYKLQELGAGITQFILVFGNVAIKEPSYILIDEPELNLHPRLQIDFITSLASYAKNGVIFATHSIGLARSIADRIYSLRNDNEKSIINHFEQTPNYAEFLGELSFTSFKELGFDKVLLVEGINEVKTIQQFLRLLKKDHEIVLLPLGGSQMINGSIEYELSEIKRICPNVSALIDSEKNAESDALSPDRQAFLELCSKLEIKAQALLRRAIENYLVERAIQEVKGSKYKDLEPYQKLEGSLMPWAKHENWRIAHAMTLEEFAGTDDLYEFLNKL